MNQLTLKINHPISGAPFAAHLNILGVWELLIGTVTLTEPLQQEFNVLELDATRCHPWSDR